MTTTKVSILDLTAAQVEAIEREIGLPVTRWSEAPSMVAVYLAVISAATGRSRDSYASVTLRELNDMVSIGDSDPDPMPPNVP